MHKINLKTTKIQIEMTSWDWTINARIMQKALDSPIP